MQTSSWRKFLLAAGADISALTIYPADLDLDREFYYGIGGLDGVPFTAWDDIYVYFPCKYDGAEWVSRVPRNPCTEATEHIGSN